MSGRILMRACRGVGHRPQGADAADADLVQAVLRASSEVLPPGPGGGDPLPISRGLIEDSHEAEEGRRLVAWAIHDARVRVPAWVIGAIRDLTAGTIAGSELPADLDDFAKQQGSYSSRQIRAPARTLCGVCGRLAARLQRMELAPEVLQMMRDRRAAGVWLATFAPGEANDFDDIAQRAGLEPLGRAWVEIDAARARQILAALLHKDLAYKSEMMTEHRASWLADEFLGSFGKYDVRFATNTADMPDTFPFGWEPATQFTFDSGVAVIGEAGSGVYWVAHED